MANIYLHTKFNMIIFISNWDMAKNTNSQWWLAPSLISKKCYFRPSNLCMANIYQAKIHLFVYFQNGGHLISWICYSLILDHPWCSLTGCIFPANRVMIQNDLTWKWNQKWANKTNRCENGFIICPMLYYRHGTEKIGLHIRCHTLITKNYKTTTNSEIWISHDILYKWMFI